MLAEHYPITRICAALAGARSSYYYAGAPKEESELKGAIERILTAFPTRASLPEKPSEGGYPPGRVDRRSLILGQRWKSF
jgi:hypothetical protein